MLPSEDNAMTMENISFLTMKMPPKKTDNPFQNSSIIPFPWIQLGFLGLNDNGGNACTELQKVID